MTERLRPMPFLEGAKPYRVPRHPAPLDLVLDGNEGLQAAPDVVRRMADLDPEVLRRYPSPRALETVIAERFGRDVEEVLVTNGGDDALDRACRAILGPGRSLVLPVPTFEMIGRYARAVGAEVREVPWPTGPWPVDAVLAAADASTRAVAVVSPNNPTGAVASVDEVVRVARALPGALVLLDLAYVEFADEDPTKPALDLGNVVVFRTLSKAWGLAGLRVGYALGPPEVLGWMRAAGHPYPVAGPSLAFAAHRLASAEHEVARFVNRVKSDRFRLSRALKALGAKPLASQGNFVLAEVPDALWLRDALAGLGIGVRAWPDHPTLGRFVRITCPGDAEQLHRLVAGLQAAMKPEALLFDLDGVLADVSRSYREAILGTVRSFGAEVGPEDVRALKLAGNANNDWVVSHRLVQARGVSTTLAEVTERFEKIYQGDGDVPGLRATESLLGGRALLQRLAAKRPLAIVTGRPRADAERFLGERGVRDLFRAVVAMEDAPLKPDPAPVRKALDLLGVRSAWMVGDTPDDLRAARAAGVVPLGVHAPGDPSGAADDEALLASGAARVLRSLDELETMLP